MINFINFIRTKFSEYTGFPIRQGTIMDETAIKPTGLVMSDIYNVYVENYARNNIANWENMTEDQMDYFANKFFYPRVEGGKAFGVVRIWLNESVNVDITEDFRAVSFDNLLYVAKAPRIISRSELKDDDNTYGQYYFDLTIEAELAGSLYDKVENQITSVTGIDYAYITNPKPLIGAIAHEDNSVYRKRLEYGINDRSMANARSVYANMKKQFPYIQSSYVAGAGNRYMQRDKLQAVDISLPKKEAIFLGKIQGDTIVKNYAYYGIFPPAAGSQGAVFNGPFSIYSDYDKTQTVEAVDMANTDPAYHGYPLYQEATNGMYRGLYYDDYRNFMSIKTDYLFNIDDEDTYSNKLTPSEDWIVGANSKVNGDYGLDETSVLDKVDIVEFNGGDITIKGGTGFPITASKNINKRTGVKLFGSFRVSENIQSSMQFMVGGPDLQDAGLRSMVDSFSGIGFGVRLDSDFVENSTKTNAKVYFANNQRYGSVTVFAQQSDWSFGASQALAEKAARIKPGKEYEFEFVIDDSLALSLYIIPIDGEDGDNFETWTLDKTILSAYATSINSRTTTKYGSIMKITVDSGSKSNSDEWVVSNLRATDLASHRANALYMFDVENLEEPLSLIFRGSGSGANNNGNVAPGHSVFIWNTELQNSISQSSDILSSGAWETLDGVSDPNGESDAVLTSLSELLVNIDRYKVQTQYGNIIIVMVMAEGKSLPRLKASGNNNDDVQSSLDVDYIKVQDQQIDTYRSNNKADVYVTTIRNIDAVNTTEKTLTGDFFIEGPTIDIIEITDIDGNLIDEDEYTLSRLSDTYINSVYDKIFISAEGYNSIIVTYSFFSNIQEIQDFYKGAVFGETLVKHKAPVYLDLDFTIVTNEPSETIIQSIKDYIDDNFTTVFSKRSLLDHLSEVASYADVTGTYNGEPITDVFTIESIEFFRTRDMTISEL